MSQLVRVVAQLLRTNGSPLAGDSYRASLYDQDPLRSDHLCNAKPDKEGRVEFTFDLSKASSLDTPFEQRPDLYVVVYDGDNEIFRSQVSKDVDFLATDPVSHRMTQLTQDLGVLEVSLD